MIAAIYARTSTADGRAGASRARTARLWSVIPTSTPSGP
jgi:hypothetical protein